MSQVRMIVVSSEEADDGIAELWCGPDLMGVTCLCEGELQLRIESRADGQPWLVDTTSLAHAIGDASRLLAAY
jgi:hypothetical protein